MVKLPILPDEFLWNPYEILWNPMKSSWNSHDETPQILQQTNLLQDALQVMRQGDEVMISPSPGTPEDILQWVHAIQAWKGERKRLEASNS